MKSIQSIQEIVKTVDQSQFNHRHAPGKAQEIILEALDIEAESFGHANAIFKALGFTVAAVRQGRKSVPCVHMGALAGGAMNRDGEGESWDLAPDVDLSAIDQWVAAK